ncbi:YjdF family protein [Thermoflavimicrobium daqui]|jgi:hypothetical protein|uniref:DUF2992 domain-containing protein n=1 Tax=Thermoflavimicrobium daqui TaxID=2137476 RepID=A0A364K4M0_9BACL|nr:YjdF family protein [Thermoflavimicrobium daqui]RAL24324.1 DUF2992 domain-containing protein [Thermoflavimicrobium daqui]
MKLTVYFDDQCQFWVGVVEEQSESKLKAAKKIFGSEPKDQEILDFIQYQMLELIEQTDAMVYVTTKRSKKQNPKRLARQAAKEMKQRGVTTFAQEAIKLTMKERKKERIQSRKQQKQELAERKRQLKIEKRKAKHRGR